MAFPPPFSPPLPPSHSLQPPSTPLSHLPRRRLRAQGVKDVVRDVFLPWYNAYRFLVQVVRRFKNDEGKEITGAMTHIKSDNLMDQWIQAAAAGLLQFVNKEMKVCVYGCLFCVKERGTERGREKERQEHRNTGTQGHRDTGTGVGRERRLDGRPGRARR